MTVTYYCLAENVMGFTLYCAGSRWFFMYLSDLNAIESGLSNHSFPVIPCKNKLKQVVRGVS